MLYNMVIKKPKRCKILKIAVIDDEQRERETLIALLDKWSMAHDMPLEILSFESSAAFRDTVTPGAFSIIFFDIYMNGTNGIDDAKFLREFDKSALIVFHTASNAHRADAFSVHAFDYLEKPAKESSLFQVMDDAMAIYNPKKEPFIELSKGKQIIRLLCSDILYATADLQYCQICTGTIGRFRISFREIEKELLRYPQFLLINRGIIINMDQVRSMENLSCVLEDGSCFPIHTKRAASIRQAFISYQFAKRTESIVRRSAR